MGFWAWSKVDSLCMKENVETHSVHLISDIRVYFLLLFYMFIYWDRFGESGNCGFMLLVRSSGTHKT